MVDKLAKALDGLKNMQFTTLIADKNISKKEKMFFCVLTADVMVSVKPINLQNLPMVIETMINLCDDNDSDVRMVADESLNRIITSLPESTMPRVNVELHKIIQKNGPPRHLRAALIRFSQLSQYIRPNKGRIYVQKLIPCLIEISKREEESVHETLASSFENIFKVLGVFMQDNSLKSLIKAFLHNLSSDNPVIRRSSATCIIKLVQFCRKPHVFNSFVLNSLLDCVVPICEDNSTDLILGVLGCLRLLLPTLTSVKYDEGISGSFGLRRKKDESFFSVDRLIQAYELCLHYTKCSDHNVVAAALETLNQILQNPPQQLESLFLSPSGFSRSYIHSSKDNKLWSRSGSEMSVACSLPPMDESFLLDDSDISSQFPNFSSKDQAVLKNSLMRVKEKIEFSEDDTSIVENPFREKVVGKMFGSQSTLDNDSDTEDSIVSELSTPPLLLMRGEPDEREAEESVECSRSNSQDNLYSPNDSEQMSTAQTVTDVGSFTDSAVPLIYCVRHLTASFLLDSGSNGLKSDRTTRVSIKSLAFSCISAAVKLYPVLLKMSLSKTENDNSVQIIGDILSYTDHCDPQIRGCVNVLVGLFIQSSLLESKGHCSDWLDEENSKLNFKNLIGIILKGLKDKSSVCNRQALSAVKMCVNLALLTPYNTYFLPILGFLPVLTDSSYWLVKAKLIDVLCDLPYEIIYDLMKSDAYQEEVIDYVLLPLLGDEDSRVRLAAAEGLARIMPLLSDGNSPELEYAKSFTGDLNEWLRIKENFSYTLHLCPPFSHASTYSESVDSNKKTEFFLSKIVAKLTNLLFVSDNKHFLFGHIEVLKNLTEKYPPTVYLKGWNCSEPKADETKESGALTSDLITFVYSLLVTSPSILDLTAFSNATILMGNLFAGHCMSNLKSNYHVPVGSETEASGESWKIFISDRLSELGNEIFTHLLKVLNLYSGLVEEVPVSNVSESSASANSFFPIFSPTKKQEKKPADKLEERKAKNAYYFAHTTHYVKLQQLLKNAYTNYKVSLDKPVGDKFLNLLESTLYTLSVLLEVGTVQETGRYAKEILYYLHTIVSLRPCPAVLCVIQLLKSLLGINLAANWEGKKFSSLNFKGIHLFDSLFQLPTEFLSERIHRRTNLNSLERENLSGRRRKSERKFITKSTDKNWLAVYVRLFEPMIVKSLQLYTITGNVKLQSNVLQLLNQLVELRVNYCVFDAKQVFVEFVLKQFELIEQGQVPEVEILLPHIFKFFVLLSYEKQHSQTIMSIPKILQLCDGLMASDQPVQTHCIPALVPVVEDVFLLRNFGEDKELETQREVLFSMLLRLVEFPQVMDMLASILRESKTVEEKEKWKHWSRQVIDVILPLASQDRLRIETFEGQNSFINLMSSLSPNVLRPIDPLLRVLFTEPNDYNCSTTLKRWLARVTVTLETVLFVKEDTLLNRLEEITPNVNLATFVPVGNICSPDPLNVSSFFQVYEPSETVARFLLKTVSVITSKILESFSSSLQLQQKLSMFFVCVYHILRSGTFHRITNSFRNLLAQERDSLPSIFYLYKKLIYVCPLLVCQFSYFLTLLNYCDKFYWSHILGNPITFSAKLVQWCGVISLSDYVCDNLSDTDTFHYLLINNTQEILILSHEIPVKELLMTISRRKSDWSVFIKSISVRNFENFEPEFVEKLLRLLELSDTSHSVALLILLVDKYLATPRLALSLLAGSIACRQVEFLLTLPAEKVVEELDEKSFKNLMTFFDEKKYFKRHFNLWSLLKKLGAEVFKFKSSDPNRSSSIETKELKSAQLQEDWYFNQVKHRCCQKSFPGSEIPFLLNKLSYQRILDIFSDSDFSIKILKDCLIFPENQRKKFEMPESDGNLDASTATDDSLYRASKCRLAEAIREIVDDLVNIKKDSKVGFDSPEVLSEFHSKKNLKEKFWDVASSLTVLLETIYARNSDVEDEFLDGAAEIGISCVEIIGWSLEKGNNIRFGDIYQNDIESGFKCCSAVLRSPKIKALMSRPSNRERLKGCIKLVNRVLSRFVPLSRFNQVRQEEEDSTNESELTELSFLFKFVTSKSSHALLPRHLINCIRDLTVNICRIPEMSSRMLKVPDNCDMQDIELLESFISRFSVIGWSNKQQFEEIWVALLAVLGFNTQGDIPLDETGFIVQASAAAVEGITTLLKNTMLDSGGKKLIHHGRDFLSMKHIYEKLPLTSNIYRNDHFSDRSYHFLDNLELPCRNDRYVHGLLSVEYLWTAVKQITSHVDVYEKHCQELSAVGLDIPSCIYLLTELYSQWIHQTSPDIKIITASLKSSIVMSDLFTDIGQFQWLLNFCLQIDEIVMNEDTVILPLIIIGCSKAGAIVLPDFEVCERIKKLMLRSNNSPCRTAAVQGLLYLLQSYVVCYAVNHKALPPPGSTFQRDEVNFVVMIVDTFLPVALEIVQEFRFKPEPITEEFERCHWSLIFYLLQNYQSSLGYLKDEFLNFILGTLRSKDCSDSLMGLLTRGVERLLLTTVIDDHFREQVSKISLEIISHNSVTTCRHGLQLMVILSFLDKRAKDIRQLVTGQEDPEKVMKDMEKINILFEKLKKSYPKEAEVVGDVLSYVLTDFVASDVLTKVIQEFLSPHQPHQKILAGLLFKVFERAELSLLEDWAVFSLPGLIQGMSTSMSIWILNCFFVSTSREPWLRSLFPLVQSRIRMTDLEDKKLLCLSGSHFYKQLKNQSQKKSFIQAFEKAAKTDSVFVSLLSSLH